MTTGQHDQLGQALLSGRTVLEMSTSTAGAYAGRLLVHLGATVLASEAELDLDAAGDALDTALRWFGADKIKTPDDGLIEAVNRADLILIERDPRRADQLDRIAIVEDAIAALTRRPQVVYLDGAVDAEPVPSAPICTSAWSATSWSLGDADDAPLSLPFDLTAYNAALHGAALGLAAMMSVPEDVAAAPASEVSARDVMAFQTGMITANFIPYERPWRREGRRPPGSAGLYPVGLFEASDGHIVLLCRSQAEWDRLIDAMGRPAWSADPRFADPRVVARDHADEVDQHLLPWIAGQTVDELTRLGSTKDIPVAAVLSVAEALTQPQLAYRGFLEKIASDDDTQTVAPVIGPTTPWVIHEPPTTQSIPRAWPIDAERPAEPGVLLRGLRVLDLSWVWSGPMTAAILGNLGADVIKVEHSGRLDAGRARGRARRNGVEIAGPEHEVTPYFNQMNYGKRSITIDMKSDEGRALVLELAAECDVVVENMRPGALERNGLDFATLSSANPALVMISLSMAGQQGPLRSLKGYAAIMAALSGLESLVGYDDDRLVGTLSPSIGDPNAAGHALVAVLAALLRRRDTGRGAWIDLSQTEALMNVLPVPIIEAQLRGSVAVPANTHAVHTPHGHVRCAGNDRWLAIAVTQDSQWRAMLGVAETHGTTAPRGWAEWSAKERHMHRSQIDEWLAEWMANADRDDLHTHLQGVGVASAPVLSYEELVTQDWLRERQLTVPVNHRYLGDIDQYIVPWRIDGIAQTRTAPAPLLGADTDAVLRDVLHKSPEEIERLRALNILR